MVKLKITIKKDSLFTVLKMCDFKVLLFIKLNRKFGQVLKLIIRVHSFNLNRRFKENDLYYFIAELYLCSLLIASLLSVEKKF